MNKILGIIYERPLEFELNAGGIKNTLNFKRCDLSLLPKNFQKKAKYLLDKYKYKEISVSEIIEGPDIAKGIQGYERMKLSEVYTHRNNWHGTWNKYEVNNLNAPKLFEKLSNYFISLSSNHLFTYYHSLSKEIEYLIVLDKHIDAIKEPFNNSSFLRFIPKPTIVIGYDRCYEEKKALSNLDNCFKDRLNLIPNREKLINLIKNKKTFLSIDLDVLNQRKYFGFHFNEFMPLRTLLMEDIYLTTSLLKMENKGLIKEKFIQYVDAILNNSKVRGVNIAGIVNSFDINKKTKKIVNLLLSKFMKY